jgi:hypothetical protein
MKTFNTKRTPSLNHQNLPNKLLDKTHNMHEIASHERAELESSDHITSPPQAMLERKNGNIGA